MEAGASDSVYFAQAGIPSYGYSAIALERDDVRAHGATSACPSTPTGNRSISGTPSQKRLAMTEIAEMPPHDFRSNVKTRNNRRTIPVKLK